MSLRWWIADSPEMVKRNLRHIRRTCALHRVHIIKAADKVDRHVRPGQRIGDRSRLCHITRRQRDLPQIAQRFQRPCNARIPLRHPNPRARAAQSLHHITPNKPAAAEYSDQFTVQIVHVGEPVRWGG